MQHETLVFTRFDIVLTLGIALTAQRGDTDGLRFAARKQRTAVRARKKTCLARDGANHARSASVLATSVRSNSITKRAGFNLAARVDDV